MTRSIGTFVAGCFTAAVLLLASGCEHRLTEYDYPEIRYSPFAPAYTFDVWLNGRYGLFDERPEAWTYVQYPEMTPVEAAVSVTRPPETGRPLVLVEPVAGADDSRWYAVLYEGEVSPRSDGVRWAPSHQIWRMGPSPPVQPRILVLRQGYFELTAAMNRPTDPTLVAITTDSDADCVPEFRLSSVRYLYFTCTPAIVPPARLTIEFREGLEDEEGEPIPPGVYSVDVLGDHAMFDLPGPPPIPAERCGDRYLATDTNCER